MIQKVKDWKSKKQFRFEKYHSDGEKGAFRFRDETWWCVDDAVVFRVEEVDSGILIGSFSGRLIGFSSDEIHVYIMYKYMGVSYSEEVEINNIAWCTINK